jgi:lysozyme
MISNLKDQLVRDEELRLKPYTDSVGKLTIGIGRNLSDKGISFLEAQFMLANDVAATTAELQASLPWTATLDEVRKGALLNMTFNMGIGGLLEFHDFLAKLQAGDYSAAAGAMLDSLWARQVGARATRLSQQIQSGIWQ